MHRNDDDIIALWSMHNPQNAGTIFRDCLIRSRAVGVAWIRLDPIRRADRCFDPVDSNVASADRYLRVLGEADHPSLAVVLGDLRIEELAAQRVEAFEGAFFVRSHQPRIPRHIGGEDRGETAGLAHVSSPAARRRPDRNSSRSSGLRKGRLSGTTRGVMARSFATIARASS